MIYFDGPSDAECLESYLVMDHHIECGLFDILLRNQLTLVKFILNLMFIIEPIIKKIQKHVLL